MKSLILLTIRIMPILFGCCIAVITVVAIMPSANLPDALSFWDKAQHALAFATLSLTGRLAYPRKSKQVYIGLILYGAGIELVQRNFTTTHVGDVLDLLADSVGVAIGFVVYLLLRKMIKLE